MNKNMIIKITLFILVFLSGLIFGVNSPAVFSTNPNFKPEDISVFMSLSFGLFFGFYLVFFDKDKQ